MHHRGPGLIATISNGDFYAPRYACDLASHTGITVVTHGRVDNITDLREHLGLARGAGQAAVVVEGFLRWGEEVFERLIGDWNLVVHDEPNRRFIIANDCAGVLPFYFHEAPDAVLWSTDVVELAKRAGTFGEPDRDYVAGYLTFGLTPGVSAHKGIRTPIPGHFYTFSDRGPARTTRYWTGLGASLAYTRTSEYGDAYRDVLLRALRDRAREQPAIVAELSGGLDSSSIVGGLHSLVRRGELGAPLHVITTTNPSSPEIAVEAKFVNAVVEHVAAAAHTVVAEEFGTLPTLDLESPAAKHPAVVAGFDLTRRLGGSVLFSGRGGDVVLGSRVDYFQETLRFLAAGRPLAWVARCWEWAVRSGVPIWAVARQALETAASTRRHELSADRLLRIAARRKTVSPTLESVFLIDPSLRQAALRSLDAMVDPLYGTCDVARRAHYLGIQRYVRRRTLVARHHTAPIAHTYPFFDRRVLQFVLSIPIEQLFRPGASRPLVRSAMRGVVPELVLGRTSKAYASPATARALRGLLVNGTTPAQWEVVRRGYVNGTLLRDQIERLTSASGVHHGSVRLILALEQWLSLLSRA